MKPDHPTHWSEADTVEMQFRDQKQMGVVSSRERVSGNPSLVFFSVGSLWSLRGGGLEVMTAFMS